MPLPEPGTTITIPEEGYLYGRGPLTIKVTRVETKIQTTSIGRFMWVYGLLDQGQYREPREHSWLVDVAMLERLG